MATRILDFEEELSALPPVISQEQKADILDKIKAEIESYQSDAFYHDNVMMNKRMVLEIIDKYRSESEE